MSWTLEMEQLIKQMWSDGQTGSEIGNRLGRSRSAVMGKLTRMGLMGMQGRPQYPPKPRAKTERKAKPAPVYTVRKRKPPPPARPVLEPSERQIKAATAYGRKRAPLGAPDGITELKARECKWPIGDPKQADFRFCLAETEVGQVYCAEHTAAAVGPAWKSKPKQPTQGTYR